MAVTVQDAARATRSRPASRSGSRSLPHPAVLALAVLTATWVVTFSVLVVRRHHGFWDVDFDMGIHDQAIWLLAHGRGFITVRGLDVFGHHFTPDYFLLVPAYWLGAGPDFLNVVQVCALALAVVPLYLIARERSLTPWAASVVGGAFLLHPATQFFSWELFHPEMLGITPLLCAYLCSVRKSWRWFAFWCVLAVSCKEDLALAVIALGILVTFRGERRVGLVTVGLASLYFGVVVFVVIPAINGGSHLAEGFLSGVGGTPGGIIHTTFTDPGNITSRLLSSETSSFAWKLVFPFGLFSLLAPGVLLLGLPQFLIDALADVSWMRVITFHYAALPIAALALGVVEGVAFAGRRFGQVARTAAPIVVLACAVYGTIAWGPSPVGAEYKKGWWPPSVDTRIKAERAAVALVPDGASVSAVYGLVPQLTHRPEIYSFPNPWRPRNWGVVGTPTRDPRRVDWLVLDRRVLSPDDVALLDSILASKKFRIVFERDDLLVARRVHA